MAEHEDDCNMYVTKLTNAYYTQVHWSTDLSKFSLVLTRPLAGVTIVTARRLPPDVKNIGSRIAYRTRVICRVAELYQQANKTLRAYRKSTIRTMTRKSVLRQSMCWVALCLWTDHR